MATITSAGSRTAGQWQLRHRDARPHDAETSYERSNSPYGGPTPQELFWLASRSITPGLSWSFYGSKGLSSGSARLMVGTALTRRMR